MAPPVSRSERARPDPEGLLAALLTAPDRDHCPGSVPAVSYRDDDDPRYLDELDHFAPRRVSLERRGRWHGQLALIGDPGLVPGSAAPGPGTWLRRWHEARPIVLRGFAKLEPFAEDLAARRRLHDELKEEGGLRAFLGAQREELAPHFAVHHRQPPAAADPARDIERVVLHWSAAGDGGGPRMRDLWAKSAWISERDDDESLRLRLSFGREIDDDSSRDVARHQRVSELAERLFPETELVHESPLLGELLPQLVGGPVFFTQHIAYWNAPGGGALFHHDAFDEPLSGGQRGVLYLQLTGSTAWLALSIEDLARRVIELGDYLEEGELAWVRARLFEGRDDFARFRRRCARFKTLVRDLGRRGCGDLGRLVNHGPEFTSLLADAGHAFVLDPGDAILLPNHGLERTAMHSVFCASDEPGYALSMALRELDPPPLPSEAELEAATAPPQPRDRPPQRRAGRRRGRGSRRG